MSTNNAQLFFGCGSFAQDEMDCAEHAFCGSRRQANTVPRGRAFRVKVALWICSCAVSVP